MVVKQPLKTVVKAEASVYGTNLGHLNRVAFLPRSEL